MFKFIVMTHKFYNATVPENILRKYEIALTEADEVLFVGYLNGVFPRQYHVGLHWQSICMTRGFGNKLHYLFDLIFPPKKFMLQKYNIQHPSLFWCWYPYRYWVGLKGLYKILFA